MARNSKPFTAHLYLSSFIFHKIPGHLLYYLVFLIQIPSSLSLNHIPCLGKSFVYIHQLNPPLGVILSPSPIIIDYLFFQLYHIIYPICSVATVSCLASASPNLSPLTPRPLETTTPLLARGSARVGYPWSFSGTTSFRTGDLLFFWTRGDPVRAQTCFSQILLSLFLIF